MSMSEKMPSKELLLHSSMHCVYLIYATFHTIIAPILLVAYSVVCKMRGNPLDACYYMIIVCLLAITHDGVMSWFEDSRTKLHNMLNMEFPEFDKEQK